MLSSHWGAFNPIIQPLRCISESLSLDVVCFHLNTLSAEISKSQTLPAGLRGMPDGYLVIKLLLSEEKQSVQKIKMYFQNHKNEVHPTLGSSLAPGSYSH